MRASAGCLWALCSHFEQHLDHADVDALFEEMRGEAVPQRMTASISSPLLFQTIGSPHTRAGSGTNPTASFSACSYDETFPHGKRVGLVIELEAGQILSQASGHPAEVGASSTFP